MTAIFLALAAAALFGLAVHVQRLGLDHADERTGAAITIFTFAGLFWMFAPLVISWAWWATGAALIYLACGTVFPILSQRLQVMSVVMLGPAITASVGIFAPVFASVPAVLFLGETVNLQGVLGLCLMIGGVAIAGRGRVGAAWTFPIWALALPIGASFFRGVVQPITKFGYAEVPSPFFATLAMSTMSAMIVAGLLLVSPRWRAGFAWQRGHLWFVLNGIVLGTGIMSLQMALLLGDVVVVSPFTATVPLWALFFGRFLFRRETLGRRHLGIAGVVCLGAILLVTR